MIDTFFLTVFIAIKSKNTAHAHNVLFPKDGMLTSSSKIFIFLPKFYYPHSLFTHPSLLPYTFCPTLTILHHPLFTMLLKFNAFSTLLLWHSNWVDTHICPPLRHSWNCFNVPYTLGPPVICQPRGINV